MGCLEHVADIITEVKRRFRDPYLAIMGDFNQWKVGEALIDFADVAEVQVGSTRGSRSIDRIFVNFSRALSNYGTLAPLETEEARDGQVGRSDHRVAFCAVLLDRKRTFKWESYSYRQYTAEAEDRFKEWIVLHDWREVSDAEGSNNKTEA